MYTSHFRIVHIFKFLLFSVIFNLWRILFYVILFFIIKIKFSCTFCTLFIHRVLNLTILIWQTVVRSKKYILFFCIKYIFVSLPHVSHTANRSWFTARNWLELAPSKKLEVMNLGKDHTALKYQYKSLIFSWPRAFKSFHSMLTIPNYCSAFIATPQKLCLFFHRHELFLLWLHILKRYGIFHTWFLFDFLSKFYVTLKQADTSADTNIISSIEEKLLDEWKLS